MPTQWANPVGVNSPVRALDIVGLREAIDRDRMPYGLPPYPWTDPALGAGTPVKAVHYLEPAAAIADLWSRKNMGPLPVWTQGAPGVGTPVRASHLTDLRTWLNTYETNPTGRLTGPLRGLHLRNGDDMRDVDLVAAKWFDPQLVVVLSPDVLRPNMKAYLQSLAPGVELFCRYYKTTYPFGSYVTFEGYGPGGPLGDWLRDGQGNLVYGGTSAEQKNPPQVAQDIVDLYDAFLAAGVNITRFYVGNEPELE